MCQRGAYKPGDSGRRGVLVDHPAVQQQIIQIIQILADLRGAGVPLNAHPIPAAPRPPPLPAGLGRGASEHAWV